MLESLCLNWIGNRIFVILEESEDVAEESKICPCLNRDKQNKMDELMVINTWICVMSLRADIPNMVIRGTQLRLLLVCVFF